jgi:hypothetical protein
MESGCDNEEDNEYYRRNHRRLVSVERPAGIHIIWIAAHCEPYFGSLLSSVFVDYETNNGRREPVERRDEEFGVRTRINR